MPEGHIEADVVLWFLSGSGQINHPSNEGAFRADCSGCML